MFCFRPFKFFLLHFIQSQSMNACRLHGVNIQYNPDWGSQVKGRTVPGRTTVHYYSCGEGHTGHPEECVSPSCFYSSSRGWWVTEIWEGLEMHLQDEELGKDWSPVQSAPWNKREVWWFMWPTAIQRMSDGLSEENGFPLLQFLTYALTPIT